MKLYKSVFKETSNFGNSYQATIYFARYEYKGLEKGKAEKKWEVKVSSNILEDCLEKVAKEVRAKSYKEFYHNVKSYSVDETELLYTNDITDDGRKATKEDFELCKLGKKKIWRIECKIYVYKIEKSKISDEEIKKLGIKRVNQ